MYRIKTSIQLRDTDATGVLYFTEQQRLALMTFEEYMKSKGFSLNDMLNGDFLMPIVHAEADYSSSLEVGDEIEILLEVERIGEKSFTLKYTFYKDGAVAGSVKIVHVPMDRATRQSIPIPKKLLELLPAPLETR